MPATLIYTRRFISGINTKFSCVLHTPKLKHATYKHMRCAEYMYAQCSIYLLPCCSIHTVYILHTCTRYTCMLHTCCIHPFRYVQPHVHVCGMHVAEPIFCVCSTHAIWMYCVCSTCAAYMQYVQQGSRYMCSTQATFL